MFPLTIWTVTAEWSNNLIRYTLYEQSDGGQDAGTSAQGGADGGQRQIGMLQLVYASLLTTYILEHQDNPKTALPHTDPLAGLFIESLGDSPREGSHDDTLGTSITPVEITPPGDLDDLDDARTTYHG